MTTPLLCSGTGAAEAPVRPWIEGYPDGIAWDQAFPPLSLPDMFAAAAARFAARPCLDFLGRTYSYAEVARLVDRAAKGFQGLGVGPGVRVGLCLPNTPYSVIAYFGVLKAGGTVVNFNPLYAEREMMHQVEDSGTELMVTIDLRAVYPQVAALLGRTRLKRIVVCPMTGILPPLKSLLFRALKRRDRAVVPEDDRHVRFATLIGNDGRPAPVTLDPLTAVAVLQYTGGTTGVPKGAMLTHANLTANARQVLAWFVGVREGQERLLAILPFFHVFAMTVAMNLPLLVGAEIVLLPRFEIGQVLATVRRCRPTLLPGVPTMYKAILDAPESAGGLLRSIRLCISGGAPLPVELKRRFEEATGCVLVEGYGLTECSPVATCNPLHGENREGSIGLPLPGVTVEIRALDDPTRCVPVGEKGQVAIAGPHVMAGYLNCPEDTARTLVDGFLLTGDVGRMDGQGYVFLLDRLKEMILCGGYNVYPRVIEEAIHQHPAVDAVCVIGIRDPYRGQTPKAFVQLRPGASLDTEELRNFLAERISRIEMPKHIEFRDELPKTAVGKLSKKVLIEEAERAGEA